MNLQMTEPHQVVSVTVYKQLNAVDAVDVVVVVAVVQLHSVWIMTAGAGARLQSQWATRRTLAQLQRRGKYQGR